MSRPGSTLIQPEPEQLYVPLGPPVITLGIVFVIVIVFVINIIAVITVFVIYCLSPAIFTNIDQKLPPPVL